MTIKNCEYTYFYILDHLGSTSMILDVDGNISQSVTYIPYGEIFVEERNGTWNSPYLFNSKELDEETGLYYYGARYLNPTNGMWLSTDPLFEKNIDASPYSYCHGNPVNKVDVMGLEDFYAADGDYIGQGANLDNKSKYIVTEGAEARRIRKNYKKGIFTDLSAITSAYELPSDAVLKEALNILNITKKYEGEREVATLVLKDGNALPPNVGDKWENQNLPPTVSLPEIKNVNEVEASIHSHPYIINGNNFSSADIAGIGDVETFSQFDTNVIVGKGNGSVNRRSDPYMGTSIQDNRSFGVAFYGKKVNRNEQNILKCNLWLSEKAVNNILKRTK